MVPFAGADVPDDIEHFDRWHGHVRNREKFSEEEISEIEKYQGSWGFRAATQKSDAMNAAIGARLHSRDLHRLSSGYCGHTSWGMGRRILAGRQYQTG
jgi:hypothetical protein